MYHRGGKTVSKSNRRNIEGCLSVTSPNVTGRPLELLGERFDPRVMYSIKKHQRWSLKGELLTTVPVELNDTTDRLVYSVHQHDEAFHINKDVFLFDSAWQDRVFGSPDVTNVKFERGGFNFASVIVEGSTARQKMKEDASMINRKGISKKKRPGKGRKIKDKEPGEEVCVYVKEYAVVSNTGRRRENMSKNFTHSKNKASKNGSKKFQKMDILIKYQMDKEDYKDRLKTKGNKIHTSKNTIQRKNQLIKNDCRKYEKYDYSEDKVTEDEYDGNEDEEQELFLEFEDDRSYEWKLTHVEVLLPVKRRKRQRTKSQMNSFEQYEKTRYPYIPFLDGELNKSKFEEDLKIVELNHKCYYSSISAEKTMIEFREDFSVDRVGKFFIIILKQSELAESHLIKLKILFDIEKHQFKYLEEIGFKSLRELCDIIDKFKMAMARVVRLDHRTTMRLQAPDSSHRQTVAGDSAVWCTTSIEERPQPVLEMHSEWNNPDKLVTLMRICGGWRGYQGRIEALEQAVIQFGCTGCGRILLPCVGRSDHVMYCCCQCDRVQCSGCHLLRSHWPASCAQAALRRSVLATQSQALQLDSTNQNRRYQRLRQNNRIDAFCSWSGNDDRRKYMDRWNSLQSRVANERYWPMRLRAVSLNPELAFICGDSSFILNRVRVQLREIFAGNSNSESMNEGKQIYRHFEMTLRILENGSSDVDDCRRCLWDRLCYLERHALLTVEQAAAVTSQKSTRREMAAMQIREELGETAARIQRVVTTFAKLRPSK